MLPGQGKGSEAKGAAKAAGTAANGGDGKAGAGGESKAARASALVSRCQRLEQENEELAASADVAKGTYRLPLVCGTALRSSICLCAMRVFVEYLEL